MQALAESLGTAHPDTAVMAAFLSLGSPDLPTAVASAADAGAGEIRILPLFFFSGKHVRDDVPRLAAQAQAAHPGTRIVVLDAAGRHPGFAAFVARAGGLADPADGPADP
jgi:sirohydrochlorin cobaltochelatase